MIKTALKQRAKPTLFDIQQLIEHCVSERYFLWVNIIWSLPNLGRIGLLVMVVLSESYLQKLEYHSVE